MLFDDKTKGIAQAYLSMLEENNKLNESHFKVGDKVKCIASGMMGTVTKLDKPEEGKYYTVKQDSGKMMKYSPDELKKVSDVKEEKIPKGYHKMPDGTIMKDSDHKKEVKEKLDPVNSKEVKKKFDDRIDKDIDNDGDVDSSDEYLHKRRKAIAKATKSEAIEIEMSKKSKLNNNNNDDDDAVANGNDKMKVKKNSKRDNENNVAESKDMMKVAKEIEVYAKKSGGVDKNDMMKVASMVKRGQVKQAVEFAKDLDSDPRDYILGKMGMMEASYGKVKEAMEKKARLPFEPTSTKKPARNSDGTPQSPMSRARALAQQGMRKQMTKEDVEQVDELSKDLLTRAKNKAVGRAVKADVDGNYTAMGVADKQASKFKKAANLKDLSKAKQRIVKKEDVEQVDELSKSTMGSYVKKASGSQFKAGHDAGEKKDTSATQSAINKASKRQQGIGRAVSKLTREKTDMEESSAVKAMARDAERRAGSVMKPKSTKPKPRPGSMEAMRAAAEKRKMREDLEWDWDAILDAPEEEIDAMIEEMNDADYESFVSEFELVEEGANMYQSSTRSKPPMTPDGKETLEPRAEADKAFTAAHRQTTDIKDYPGKDKPVTNAKSQASLRPGDKRSSEPMKTLSDIRRK